ncbi:TPA: sigma-70 family RNA polymerase sigma factor [Clostridium botulinum]|uniref:sigma-70 family RNA polymerase sigma factor n=1 Tax=Clostridium botulinum TaxID=1491 RepID=UPI0008FC9B72|nr:sigma-70 family RNA polymerase sigma factor [Clostridium botulinum]MCS4446208.1 sigma-70 family RNA polymerase sigma factor [Clostridium botulinum]MCS4456592.1 sigma-70 family RNA polymerase sigma factor [Clostridium botulinum]MCS4461097.1 sigma-70 family RNA polymerase sigma factor [Clostridium botulinum]MCS4513292.1 sigma-70 family RNA polymerase sigma factor [Clostridium botulinum]MCS4518657.1 sigma-70 family RNA polymerase sigma factor [Clostridium botulinum]
MDKEAFRKTERMVYNYFKKEEVIKYKKDVIEVLKKRIEQLEERIKKTNVNIDHNLQAVPFGERVQTSSTGISYAERAIVQAIDRLIREQADKKQEILNLEEDISNIEKDSKAIEFNIRMLNEEDKEFIKLKYKQELSVEQIADELNMSRATGYKKREKIIKDIIHWNEVIKK